MVRAAFCDKNGLKKGAWSIEEDNVLRAFVEKNGHKNWRQLPKLAGLSRCGKSCRLRWKNYLQPNLKRGKFTSAEEDIIMELHEKLGNKWSSIAEQLRGRSDNEIKNHWHTHLKKRVKNKHEMKPPADDHELKEFLINIEPLQDSETIRSSDSETSDITLDNYPFYSIFGSSTLNDVSVEEYLSSLYFSCQAPLSKYPITSAYYEEQQLVEYAAPMEIVGELISNEFWTQPYITDKDIIHAIKFTDSTVCNLRETQGASDHHVHRSVLHDHPPVGASLSFKTLSE